jgi:Holliday junction resolvase RusA-like endonuclease
VKIPRTPGGGRGKGKPAAIARHQEFTGVFSIWVPHIAAPQGSHKQGFGKSVRETNPKTEPYREAVAAACERYIEDDLGAIGDEWVPFNKACALSATFHMPPLKSAPERHWVIGPPDLDKVLRATCDGLTRGKVWKDDARLARLERIDMVHAKTLEETGVRIEVWEL